MLKNIATRAALPTLRYQVNCLARNARGVRFSFRPRGIPSAFPDWRELRMPAPRRPYFPSTFISSTTGWASNDHEAKPTSPVSTADEIKQKIAEKNEVFPPPSFDKIALVEKYKNKKWAVKLVEEFAQRMAVPKDDTLHDISRQSLSEHLLASVDALAGASTVMIFCGRNTIEGKLTPDGPVSAAIAAYALHLCYKVPIIVCDGPNRKLIQNLLTELHPEFGPYVRYVPITDVNGRLVNRLHKELSSHAPDLALYIDVPGRNSESDYLDEKGNSINLLNVAFDQALNMQNAMKKQSIAICNSITNAGFPIAISTGEPEDIAAVVRATHSLVVPDVVHGTLGLMELLCNACNASRAYQTEWLLTALNKAAQLTENSDYAAPLLRSSAIVRQSWTTQEPVQLKPADPRIQQLAAFHELAGKRRITWPAPIEKAKLEGPKVRHAVLYDSSDGVLIAAEDFLRYARARSNFHLKAHAVADHDKASYGDHKGHRLFEIVVDGIAYSAKLKADVIVMVCNTACTVDLERVRKAVADWLHAHGINGYAIQIIDLVKTVSEAVLDSGGASPTLLTTEGTMRSDAYPKAIKASAIRDGVDLPEVKVIGCGDRKERPNKDLARFVNDLAHLKDRKGPAYQELMHEVRRYVDLIPLNSSSVWLCCTHFPALKDIIKAALNERLVAAELLPDSIPIIDPLYAQVDETIRFLQKHPLTANRDYRNLVDLQVSTSGPKVKVAESMHHHIKQRNVPLFEVMFPSVRIQPAPEPRAQPAAHGTSNGLGEST